VSTAFRIAGRSNKPRCCAELMRGEVVRHAMLRCVSGPPKPLHALRAEVRKPPSEEKPSLRSKLGGRQFDLGYLTAGSIACARSRKLVAPRQSTWDFATEVSATPGLDHAIFLDAAAVSDCSILCRTIRAMCQMPVPAMKAFTDRRL